MKEYYIKIKEPIGIVFIINGIITRTPLEAKINEKELLLVEQRLKSCAISDYELEEIIIESSLPTLEEVVQNNKLRKRQTRKARNITQKNIDLSKISNPKFDPINDIDPDTEKKEEEKEMLQRLLENDFDIEELE